MNYDGSIRPSLILMEPMAFSTPQLPSPEHGSEAPRLSIS